MRRIEPPANTHTTPRDNQLTLLATAANDPYSLNTTAVEAPAQPGFIAATNKKTNSAKFTQRSSPRPRASNSRWSAARAEFKTATKETVVFTCSLCCDWMVARRLLDPLSPSLGNHRRVVSYRRRYAAKLIDEWRS